MSCAFKTLLPQPTTVELALEEEMAQKYCRLSPDIIKALHDPWACPLEFLPWLAYAYSVDTWNDVWPEATKRAVVANSIAVHTHKGTRGGVEDALAALGVEVKIEEWWQQVPQSERGTMRLTLSIHGVLDPSADILISAALLLDIIDQINHTKRASIHFIFSLLVETTSPTGLALVSSGQLTTHQQLEAAPVRLVAHASRPLGFAVASSGQLTTHQQLQAAPVRLTAQASAPLGLAVASSGQLTTHQQLDAEPMRLVANNSIPAGWALAASGQLTTHCQLEVSIA